MRSRVVSLRCLPIRYKSTQLVQASVPNSSTHAQRSTQFLPTAVPKSCKACLCPHAHAPSCPALASYLAVRPVRRFCTDLGCGPCNSRGTLRTLRRVWRPSTSALARSSASATPRSVLLPKFVLQHEIFDAYMCCKCVLLTCALLVCGPSMGCTPCPLSCVRCGTDSRARSALAPSPSWVLCRRPAEISPTLCAQPPSVSCRSVSRLRTQSFSSFPTHLGVSAVFCLTCLRAVL